jgi:hypothetical protein
MLHRESRPGGTETAPRSLAADILSISPDAWHSTPTAEDRAVQAALEVLHEFGYGIAMRCLDCQHPITSASSLRRMRGPRCAAKHQASSVDGRVQ